jgi:ribonuclease HIII
MDALQDLDNPFLETHQKLNINHNNQKYLVNQHVHHYHFQAKPNKTNIDTYIMNKQIQNIKEQEKRWLILSNMIIVKK